MDTPCVGSCVAAYVGYLWILTVFVDVYPLMMDTCGYSLCWLLCIRLKRILVDTHCVDSCVAAYDGYLWIRVLSTSHQPL